MKKTIIVFFLLVLLVKITGGANLTVGFGTEPSDSVSVAPVVIIESNLSNVNNSDYWDGLDTPADINAGDITDDGTYCLTDDWTSIDDYPTACSSGEYVEGLGDSLTCSVVPMDYTNIAMLNETNVFTGDMTVPNLNSLGNITTSEIYDSSLVGWWQFNNNQSLDSSIYGNDGSFEGGANAVEDVLECGGVGYVSLGNNVFDDIASVYTISLWAKVEKYVLSNDFINFEGRIARLQMSLNDYQYSTYDGSTTTTVATTTDEVTNNIGVWKHIVIQYTGTQMKMYIDGILIDDVKTANTPDSSEDRGNNIGANYAATVFFNGSIDEVKIYTRALSVAEIQQEYEEGNKRYLFLNDLKSENITTDYLQVEEESWFKSFIHIFDNVKTYFGSADDVSMEFNESDFVVKAEVGSPNYYLDTGGEIIVTDDLRVKDYSYFENDIFLGGKGGAITALGDWLSITDVYRIDSYQNIIISPQAGYKTVLNYYGGTGGIEFGDGASGINSVMTGSGDWGIGTTSPTHKLNVVGDANITGNMTTNQYYGEMWYHNHTGTTLTFEDTVWNPLYFTNADMLNGFTFTGGFMESSNLTAQVGGRYKADYRLSGSGQNNHIYHSIIMINGIEQEKCGDHKKMAAGGDLIPMGHSCFIDLNVGDTIAVAVRDYGGSGTGDYYSSNINLVRIGDV